MDRPALLCVCGRGCPKKSADGQEKNLSVTAYAVPLPPKGEGLLQLTNRCIKAPPSGELSPQVTERVHPAVPLCGSTRENVVPKSPQTFRYHKIKIILLRFSTKISEDVEKPIGGCIFLRKNVVK